MNTLFPLRFSASMMESVYRCQTSFFREHIQRLRNISQNEHLIAGGHFAKACEIVRTEYFTNGKDKETAIEIGQDYILSSEDTNSDVKSNENVAYCLGKYFKTFPLEESLPPCSLANGTHAVEYKFDFDLGIEHPDIKGTNITFTGKLDYLAEKVGLLKTTRHGLDEKTCTSIFRLKGTKTIDYAKECAQYRTNGQILAYCWAARELGVPLESFFIRKVPILTSYEPAFELELSVTDFAIDLWYHTTRNLILDLVEKYKTYKSLPKDSRVPIGYMYYPSTTNLACLSYSSPCRFQEGCLHKDGEEVLKEKFNQRIYDSETSMDMGLDEYLTKLGLQHE